MRNYRLHLIRHGLTESNLRGQYAGRRTDTHLCQEGIRELIDLRESYEYPAVGLVFSSPLARCIQTAGIVYPDRPLLVHNGLAEADFGEFDGKTGEELRDRADFQQWVAQSSTAPPPGGESAHEVMARAYGALDAILRHMAAQEIFDAAIVTHGGAISCILSFMALPRLPVGDRMVGNGRGYTCYANPQLWQRDHILEVAGIMPHGADSAGGMSSQMLSELQELADQGGFSLGDLT